jgi:hypothetical protein
MLPLAFLGGADKISVKLSGVSAEIRVKHLPSTIREHFHFTNLLGFNNNNNNNNSVALVLGHYQKRK